MPALTATIKTTKNRSLYYGLETNGEIPLGTIPKVLRYTNDEGLEGSTEEMKSETVMPDTRIPAQAEPGTQSSSGSIKNEFAADEYDEWFSGLLGNEWETKKRLNLRITGGCITSGSVSITLPELDEVEIPLLAGDTSAQVAAKIAAGTFTGWSVEVDMANNAELVFTQNDNEVLTGSPVFSAGTTGVMASIDAAIREEQELIPGSVRKSMYLLKKYSQEPVKYKLFRGLRHNQLTIDFALNKYVTLDWSLQGANDPKLVTDAPISLASAQAADSSLPFNTRSGFVKVDNVANRQCSDLQLVINNNLEKTDALFETESIEQSLGDLEITGSLTEFFTDGVLYNAGKEGLTKVISVRVSRTVGTETKQYTFYVRGKFKSPSESGDKKYSHKIPFQVYSEDGFKIIKQTISA